MVKQKCMIEAEVLKPVLTLIDEKVKIQDECEKVKRSLMDVLNAPKSLVSIDVNDVRDLFQDGGRIHAYDTSVDTSKENRMALIMEQIMSKAKHFEPYNHALVFFFFPEGRPLLMEELKPFSDWIESVPGEFMVKWGMATQFTQDLRAIVILQ